MEIKDNKVTMTVWDLTSLVETVHRAAISSAADVLEVLPNSIYKDASERIVNELIKGVTNGSNTNSSEQHKA